MNRAIFLLAILVAALVQAILPEWSRLGVRLELLPILGVYFALNLPMKIALGWIFLAAVAADTFSAMPLGLSVLPFCGIGAVLSSGREMFFREKIEAQALVGGVATAVMSLLLWILLRATGGGPVFSWRVPAKVLCIGVLAAAMSPVVFFVLNKFQQRVAT